MSYVILGAGSVGFQLAKQLVDEYKDVVLIEKDPEKAKRAANALDCLVINEAGNKLETLRRAGIGKAEYFIGITDSDEVNMIACGMVSGESGVPYKVARIRNLDYSGTQVVQKAFLSIDHIVNPEIEASRAIIRAIERGAVSDVVFFEKGDLQMRSITVSGSLVFNNKSIEEIKGLLKAHFLAAVILRENHYLIPRGETVVRENDKLYLIATEESFESIFSQVGKKRRAPKKIVIIGGSTVGRYVAEHFLRQRRPGFSIFRKLLQPFSQARKRLVNIIDSDYENCKRLAEQYPEAMVINADISDEGFSEEEQFADSDVVVATTDNQELNIVNAVYAKTLGAKRSIVLVNKSSYVQIAPTLDIDVAISPIDSMVSSILRFIRTSNVRSVHSLSGGKVEVMELSMAAGSPAEDKRLKNLKLPRDTLILSVTRGQQDIIPDGELVLLGGDHIIVIARKESVPKIEELFIG
jgi:trk system potassium uptake protein TrkA